MSKAPRSKARTGTIGAHRIVPGWRPTCKTLKALADELGMRQEVLLNEYLPVHVALALERDYQYRNWNIAFRRCVRADWGGLRGAPSGRVSATSVHL